MTLTNKLSSHFLVNTHSTSPASSHGLGQVVLVPSAGEFAVLYCPTYPSQYCIAMHLCHNQSTTRHLLDQVLGQRAGVLVVAVTLLRIVQIKLDRACSNPSSVSPGLTGRQTRTRITPMATMEVEVIQEHHPANLGHLQLEDAPAHHIHHKEITIVGSFPEIGQTN
jgi:hypothetical protein